MKTWARRCGRWALRSVPMLALLVAFMFVLTAAGTSTIRWDDAPAIAGDPSR